MATDTDPDLGPGPDASVGRREKSYRGISQRLAVHYLRNLGGTPLVDGDPAPDAADESVSTVAGEGWLATLDSEKVNVAGSLTLTEVRIEFEGSAEALDPLIEAFSQKAMRAGG